MGPPLFGRVFASRSAAPLLTEVGKARDALIKIVANNNSFLGAGGVSMMIHCVVSYLVR